MLQNFPVNEFQVFGEVKVSVGEDGGVSWVVIFGMEVNEVFVFEVSNVLWVTSRVKFILGFRE